MLNNIYIQNIKILSIEKLDGKHKYFLLENGEKNLDISKPKLDMEIECICCKNRYKIQTVTSTSNGHLKKQYKCFSCNSKGENNSFYGKKHTNEFKEKLSKDRAGIAIRKDNRPNFDIWVEKYGIEEANKRFEKMVEKQIVAHSGEKNHFYGKKHTDETIQKLSVTSKSAWENHSDFKKMDINNKRKAGIKKFSLNNPEKMIENKKKAAKKSWEIQSKNFKMNKIETRVDNYFEINNIFNMDYSVILGFNQFDFGNKEKRILLEVHGDYWHCNPNLYKQPKNKTQKIKIERDKEKKEFAEKFGFKYYVIWEEQIKNNDFSTLDEILTQLKDDHKNVAPQVDVLALGDAEAVYIK